MSTAPLRSATPADAEAIADIWHAAWHDAHDAHVPTSLVDARPLPYFVGHVPGVIDRSTVAVDDSGIVGFVTVNDDELDLLFVDARGRGSGVAIELLTAGEQAIAARFEFGWLEVVTGNARARAFYAREGWRDAGTADHVIDTSSGPAVVPSHRYEKWLGR
jgi:GNAT superfamily N-acetyltransferase